MSVAPTLYLGLRITTTTPVYDDPEHPDRPTSFIHSPAWVPEDVGLIAGLDMYESSLCRCGHPKQLAWHSDMDGDFDATTFLCHACTAAAEDGRKVKYTIAGTSRDFVARPLPPFRLGVTTTDD